MVINGGDALQRWPVRATNHVWVNGIAVVF
jgi:hypothetical protein